MWARWFLFRNVDLWCFWMENVWHIKCAYGCFWCSAFSMWGLQKLHPFLMCSTKSRKLITWMLLSLHKQQQSGRYFYRRPQSLSVSVSFSCFPILTGNICVQICCCCFVPADSAVQWEFPAKRSPYTWECSTTAMGPSTSPLPVED